MKLPAAVADALASAINRYLALDPDAAARLQALEGRSIALELRGFEVAVRLRIEDGRVLVVQSEELPPDTTLRGTPLGFARLGTGGDSTDTLFSGEVTISGDVETGQAFKEIMDGVEIDWEERLSGVTGDLVAHQVGNAARATGRWLRQARSILEQDLGEYLQEELRVLPTRIEIGNFVDAVDGLRLAVERAEARIRRLEAARNKP